MDSSQFAWMVSACVTCMVIGYGLAWSLWMASTGFPGAVRNALRVSSGE